MEQRPAGQPLGLRRRPEDDRRADEAFASAIALTLLGVAGLYLLMPTIMALLLLSALLAYAMLPLVDRMDERLPGRWHAVLAITLGVLGILALLVLLLAPALSRQLGELPEVFGELGRQLSGLWSDVRDRLPAPARRVVDSSVAAASAALQGWRDPQRATRWATSAASGITALAGAIVFLPIFVLLMLRRFHSFVGHLAALVPPRWRPRFFARVRQADRVLSGFVRGQMLVALLLAVVYGAAFTLIGVPLGLVLGFLAGLGELVPFLGGIIAVVFGSLMALAGGDPADLFWVLGVYFGVQALEAAVLSRWTVGRKARLGAITAIVALIVGFQLFGVVGLLLSVPVTAVLKVAGQAAVDAYRASPFFQRGTTTA